MKILFTVEFFHPHVGGSEEVIKQIATGLVSRGHQVTVATTRIKGRDNKVYNGILIEEFSITGNAVRGIKGESERYQQFLLEQDFDLMVNYAAQQWATDLVFPILNSIPYKKILIPCGFSKLYSPDFRGYFADIVDILARYDHLIFHSKNYRDINFAREHGFHHYTVIPNGASQNEFTGDEKWFRTKYRIKENTPVLLCVGNHTAMKGHGFLIDVFSKLRIDEGVLIIIGKGVERIGCLPRCKISAFLSNHLPNHKRRILLLDAPRHEVIQAFYAADLYLMASKVECAPLVLVEAMASNTPFVSIDVGNAAELVYEFECGIITPTNRDERGYSYGEVNSFVSIVSDLLKGSEHLRAMGERGHQAWKKGLTWDKIVERYEQVFQMIVK